MRTRSTILILFSTCLILQSRTFAQQEDVLAITHAVIIDGSGRAPLLDGTILLHNERVQQIGPASEVPVPKNAQIIDAHGKSVLPGLTDMHVHLVGGWDGEQTDLLSYRRYLNSLLFAEVTVVLDTGNIEPYVLQMRQEIAAGRLTGPRIYCVGSIVDGPDPIWPPISQAVVSESQLRRIVAKKKEDKVDLVKAYVGLSYVMVEALSKEAKAAGLRVVIDQWRRNGSSDLMRTGISGFAHLPSFEMSEEGLKQAHDSNMFFISTLSVYEAFSRRRFSDLSFLEDKLIAETSTPWDLEALRAQAKRQLSKEEQGRSDVWRQSLRNAQHNAKLLLDQGVLLTAGTDAPYPGDFQGEGIHHELELLVEAGLTPLQVISVATGMQLAWWEPKQSGEH
jgi:hypothetical protein